MKWWLFAACLAIGLAAMSSVGIMIGERSVNTGIEAQGGTFGNPDAAFSSPAAPPTLNEEPLAVKGSQPSEAARPVLSDAQAILCAAELSLIAREKNTDTPVGREGPAMVYDLAQKKVVLFGGYYWENGQHYLQDIWEWDGTAGSWTNRTPAGTKPGARRRHAMAYDATRGKVVVFGGRAGEDTDLQDTWEWDGSSGTWTERTPSLRGPAARNGHAMSYDATRGKVILLGGACGRHRCGDMWEWDGTTGTWSERASAGDRPYTLWGLALAYDGARGKVVLFGGSDNWRREDTWEWDGASGKWTDRKPAGPPRKRNQLALAYDTGRRKVVMFGGDDNDNLRDTWEWNGDAGIWTERKPTGVIPPATHGHAMTYDEGRRTVVQFGGYDGYNRMKSIFFKELWEWDGTAGTWAKRTPVVVRPSVRDGHVMAHDAARGKVVLFGGYSWEEASQNLQDTWEWDQVSRGWFNRTSAGKKPVARRYHAVAYDTGRGKLVVFGGFGSSPLGDTWEWDGEAGRWTPVGKTGAAPSARYYHAMVYDEVRRRVVMFGGYRSDSPSRHLQDLWEWDGTSATWTERTTDGAKPPARWGHTLAYDTTRGKVVLTGGYDSSTGNIFKDAWEWDGAAGTWRDATPASTNSNRATPACEGAR